MPAIAAGVSVIAACFSLSQARAARWQADAAHGDVAPTFHVERGESDGTPPWPFAICINNFNRRAMVFDLITVTATDGIIVYDEEARPQFGDSDKPKAYFRLWTRWRCPDDAGRGHLEYRSHLAICRREHQQ